MLMYDLVENDDGMTVREFIAHVKEFNINDFGDKPTVTLQSIYNDIRVGENTIITDSNIIRLLSKRRIETPDEIINKFQFRINKNSDDKLTDVLRALKASSNILVTGYVFTEPSYIMYLIRRY